MKIVTKSQGDFPAFPMVIEPVREVRFNLDPKSSVISVNILCLASWYSEVQ